MSDSTLKELWQQVAEKKSCEAKQKELTAQRNALADRLKKLEKSKLAEQNDKGLLQIEFLDENGIACSRLVEQQNPLPSCAVAYTAKGSGGQQAYLSGRSVLSALLRSFSFQRPAAKALST